MELEDDNFYELEIQEDLVNLENEEILMISFDNNITFEEAKILYEEGYRKIDNKHHKESDIY